MIEVALSYTYTDVHGKHLFLPDVITDIVHAKVGSEFIAYMNKSYKQLYISQVPLMPNLACASIPAQDVPGTMASITSLFDKKKVNIEKCSDLTIGGTGLIELIFELKDRDMLTKLSEKLEEIEPIIKPTLQSLRQPMILEFKHYLPPLEAIEKYKMTILIDRQNVLLNADIQRTLAIKDKEYYVLLSAYSRLPLIIAKFFEDPQRIVRIKTTLMNKPGALATLYKTLQNHMNILESFAMTYSRKKGIFVAFGRLFDEMNVKDARKDLILKSKKSKLIEIDSIELSPITELCPHEVQPW